MKIVEKHVFTRFDRFRRFNDIDNEFFFSYINSADVNSNQLVVKITLPVVPSIQVFTRKSAALSQYKTYRTTIMKICPVKIHRDIKKKKINIFIQVYWFSDIIFVALYVCMNEIFF